MLLLTTPTSARHATTTAKIIPNTNIIVFFLFNLNYLSPLGENLYLLSFSDDECREHYLLQFILLLIELTCTRLTATTAKIIPNTTIIFFLSLIIIYYCFSMFFL